MNTNEPGPPSDGGGFTNALSSDRVMRGAIARWAANTGWLDRDGLPLPPIVLVIGYTTVLRRSKNKRPEYKTEHPLPDPEQLNAAIPVTEWEPGIDGKPRKPWALTYVVYMVDLQTGALFTYAHDTFGAMLGYNALEERIAVMRVLRGEHVFPIVRLEKRPWRSATYGMQMRPHWEPTGDWRSPGGFQAVSPSPTPQIHGSSTPTAPTATPTPQISGPSTPTPPPISTPTTPATPTTPPPAAATPPTAPAAPILDHMQPVKPVTVGELIADEIPWK